MNIYADAFKSAFASVSRRACLGLEDSSHGESFLEEPKSMKQSSLEKAGEVSKMMGVIGALMTTNSARANAISFFPSDAQKGIDSVAAFQKPVYELLNMLKPSMVPNAVGVYSMQQQLKGGKDDSDVVLLYNINYIIPLQKKMDEVAGKLKLEGEGAERIETLPKLMLGHSLELKAAIKSQDAKEQLKEVEEVFETLNEFLALASKKYEVKRYVDVKQISDKDLYGPLGCEFWGKERADGSNACVEKPGKQ